MQRASFYCQNAFETSFTVVRDCMHERAPIIIAAVPVRRLVRLHECVCVCGKGQINSSADSCVRHALN